MRPWRIELQPEHWQCPDLPLIDDRDLFFKMLFDYNILLQLMQLVNLSCKIRIIY